MISTTPRASEELIPLKDGFVIPREVAEYAIDAEFRGLRFSVEGRRLLVRPRELVTKDDDETIKRLRDGLVLLTNYIARQEAM